MLKFLSELIESIYTPIYLSRRFSSLYQQGRYKEALASATELCNIAQKILGENHPLFARSLNNLAEIYGAIGNYKKAIEIHKQAGEIIRNSVGEENRYFAINLNNIACLYADLGNYILAENLCQQAMKIRRKVLGEHHLDYASSLLNLAAIYDYTGRYSEAEQLHKQAIKLLQERVGKEHPDFARSLNNLALVYENMGNYATAEPLLWQAINIWRSSVGEAHREIAATLTNLSSMYKEIGNYEAAKPLLEQALEIERTVFGEENLNFASSLSNFALLLQDMGEYTIAEQLHKQVTEILHNTVGEKHQQFARNLNNLGVLYQSMNNYTVALSYYKQAYEVSCSIFGREHPWSAVSLSNQATLYEDMGNYAAAEALYQQVIEIHRKTFGKEHPRFAKSLNNIARVFAVTERDDKSMELMQQATAIDDQMLGQIFSISSDSQRMIYIESIRAYFDTFLSLVSQRFIGYPIASQVGLELVLKRKAIGSEVLAAQRDAVLRGRYPALEPKLREWTTLRMQIAKKSLAGPGKEGWQTHQMFLTEWNAQKERIEAYLAHQIPEMNLSQKLQNLERRMLTKALLNGQIIIEFVRFTPYDFKAVPAKGESNWQADRYLAFILFAGEPDNVQMIDLGEAQEIDEMIAHFRTSITGEADHRNPESVLTELVETSKNSNFPAVRSAIFEPLRECGLSEAEPFNFRNLTPVPMALIQKVNASIGARLREKLFDPIQKVIGDRKRLFLAPDGDLSRLPFEVLPIDENRRLIDEYHISYLSTGRDVLRFNAVTSGQSTEPLVLADPDFDLSAKESTTLVDKIKSSGRRSRDLNRSTVYFQPLPGTRVEGEKIAKQLGVKEPLLAGKALETSLKACRSPRILHLATHGFFLENQKRDPKVENLEHFGMADRLSGHGLENPLLRSGLALAGANTWLKNGSLPPEAEDGILTAEDVSGLDLLDTELVVLSACETGLGEIRTGEGVFGLRRAFVLAGAKRLIMSLWQVPDQQTQELMVDFYTRVLKGQPCADALREAQLEMKKKYPNPLYWGAFICQGEPSQLCRVSQIESVSLE